MARSIVLAGLSYASAALVGAAALTAAACGSGSSPPRAHRPVRLGEEPYWVAGGKLIAFAGSRSDFPLPLRVMDSHGSHRRTVARNASTATLAPSGRTVAEITGDGRRLVLRTVTGKQLRTFRIPYAPDQRPIWAPAEQAVAIEAIKGIVVADLRGGVRLIHEGRGAPAWSPDGRWIAFWDALTT
jgi:Tol biopolymer transport system component